MRLTLKARRVLAPSGPIENGAVVIENGRITQVASTALSDTPAGRLIDVGEATLAPGFVDLHIHVGAGHDVMEASDAALASVERSLHKHGVTSYFPTTVTAPMEPTLRALDGLGRAIENAKAEPERPRRARPLGIHLEGPFIMPGS